MQLTQCQQVSPSSTHSAVKLATPIDSHECCSLHMVVPLGWSTSRTQLSDGQILHCHTHINTGQAAWTGLSVQDEKVDVGCKICCISVVLCLPGDVLGHLGDRGSDTLSERCLSICQNFALTWQDTIVAEFQGMVARLNGIFDEKAALLASLGQPHEAGPANLVRAKKGDYVHGPGDAPAQCFSSLPRPKRFPLDWGTQQPFINPGEQSLTFAWLQCRQLAGQMGTASNVNLYAGAI